MNNPNHPNFYTDNIHLLNNMNMLLGAASTGQAEQHKPGIIQYQYATNVNAAVHPMNLATTTSSAGKKLFCQIAKCIIEFLPFLSVKWNKSRQWSPFEILSPAHYLGMVAFFKNINKRAVIECTQ